MVCVEKRTAIDRHQGPSAPPIVYEKALGICGPGAACDPPRQCVKHEVCARAGEAPAAYVPPPGQDEPTGLPMRGGGGCGGCAAGNDTGADATFVFWAALVLAGAARRRPR
jgi:MYXO-CTERM domain-containing protein